MTYEERASLMKKILWAGLLIAVAAGVWFYRKPVAAPPAEPEKQVVNKSQETSLTLVHYHLPGDPASEQLAEILNKVHKKYGKLVIVSRVDIKLQPEAAKAQGVSRAPHVIIISGKEKVFEFQGLWSQAQVEQKVDEILRGIKPMTKDWRPPVPGMKRVGS